MSKKKFIVTGQITISFEKVMQLEVNEEGEPETPDLSLEDIGEFSENNDVTITDEELDVDDPEEVS